MTILKLIRDTLAWFVLFAIVGIVFYEGAAIMTLIRGMFY